MRLDPSELTLEMERMPGIPLIASSSGSVICVSITSALAPGNEVLTEMIGGSTLG